ncbi:MAG TPA: DUF58 domain-containing protein [Streptosporangiaceae bacterium]|nr:DUF58 domain-containing protein [Streptosporangiaceae bacterium]
MASPAEPVGTRHLPLRWGLSAYARRLVTLVLAGLIIAIVTRRAEFAGLTAPALLMLATWRPDRAAQLTVRVSLDTPTAVEGTEVLVTVELYGQDELDARLTVDPGDHILAGTAVVVPAGHSRRVARVALEPTRWGRRSLGVLVITYTDRYRLAEGRAVLELPEIQCRPLPAGLRSSIVLSRLPSRLGEHPARSTGDGGEFAGVREFVPGDRQRRINWPATTRHGTVHLTTFAAERTQNVVVIADETTDVGDPGSTSLDFVLRGAAGAITRYLAARDRVGLVIFAGRLSWIGPGQGQRHHQRLLDLMMATPGGWERAVGLTRLPRAALPPGSLIIVFSPLLDPRLIEALRDVRERGFSVIVVDVLNSEPGHEGSRVSSLAGRLWRLEQEAIRFSLTQIGVPVVHWDGVSSLDEPLAPYTRRVLVAHR